jgi:hypothetical protein
MVPVTLIGTGNIIKKNSFVITPGPIRIIISPPVYTDSSNTKDGESMLEEIRETICTTYAEKTRKGL